MPRTALVTGGSRGIGAAISIALKDAGYNVAATYAGNDEAAAAFTQANGIKTYKWNVGDYDECVAGISLVEADLGPVDILVNNAGITRDSLSMRMSDQDWASVMDINLSAAFRLSRGCLKGMMKRRWGRIISITSIVGVTGNPGQANYAASKAGMIAMSKSMAQEVATRGITLNCVAPGFITTAMTDELSDEQKKNLISAIPSGRLGNVDDIAAAVAFLASQEASYITGQTVHVNGGMAMI